MPATRLRMPEFARRALESRAIASLFRPDYPPFAVEVSSRRIVGVGIEHGKTGPELASVKVVELAPGVVQPSLVRPAVGDTAAFREALRETLAGLPGFTGRFSILLPDRVAKLAFVELEQASGSSSELQEIIRWKLKRSTPFRVEDGRISYQVFPEEGVSSCLVSLVQEQVIEQFEEAVSELGFQVGLVDLSSTSLWNLIEAGLPPDEGVLLLNVTEDSGSALIARRGRPVFIRCKSPAGMESLSFEEFRSELHPTLLYYQDRLGGEPIRKALVRAPHAIVSELMELLATRFNIEGQEIGIPGVSISQELLGTLAEGTAMLVAPAVGAALGR